MEVIQQAKEVNEQVQTFLKPQQSPLGNIGYQKDGLGENGLSPVTG